MTNNNIIDFFLISFVIYWIVSVIYIINWHRKQGNLSYGTVFVALLIGGVIILILWDEEKEERRRKREERERESNDRHRRWFQTMGLINRNAIPDYGRTIPPPPPISRVDRAQSERDEAIRSARERVNKNKLKDFKFLRTNVENRER
jgi:hypothetical protein